MRGGRFEHFRLSVLLVLLGALAGACGGDDAGDSSASESDSALEGTVSVFAAASLTDALSEVKGAFEDANPDVTVELNFGPSSGLREQILAGAPADVFASANTSNMDRLAAAGAASDPAVFVHNSLQIAVPAGNAAEVSGLEDFSKPDLFIGLCAEQVPCGSFGREALESAGVEPSLDTNATDVRALLTQIASGDLDAGLVYRTDVRADDAVDGIDIPDEHNIVADCPIATLSDAGTPDLARAFVEFVLSADGQDILTSFGFDPA